AVTHPHKPAYRKTQFFEQAAHDPVAPFSEHNMAPLIGVFTAAQFDSLTSRNPVIQLYAIEQLLHMMGLELSHDAYCIFTFNFKTRMHHAIRKLAGRREQQQAACIEIEAADRNPLTARHRRKALKNTRS